MTKRKRIVALLVGVLLLAGVVGTFAWLSVTGVLVNEFGFGSVAPSVDETRKDNVKRDVSVKNTGSAPAYLRVAVDIYWQDKDGARLWDEPVAGTDYTIEWGDKGDAAATNSPSSWVLASDGFYYWTSSVKPLDKTGVLIKSVSEKKADGNEYRGERHRQRSGGSLWQPFFHFCREAFLLIVSEKSLMTGFP